MIGRLLSGVFESPGGRGYLRVFNPTIKSLSDPKKNDARFTTVPIKALSDQV